MKLNLLTLASCFVSVVVADWSVQNGQLKVFSSGQQVSSQPFGDISRLSLDPFSSLEVTFDTINKQRGSQAHQTVVALSDAKSGLEIFFPALVKPNGKAKLSLSAKKVPAPLHGKPLKISVLVGSFGSERPVEVEAGSSVIVANSTPHSKPAQLGAKPEIIHQFRPSPRTVAAPIAFMFAATAVFSTVVLFGYWVSIGANIDSLPKALSNSSIGHLGLVASIVSLEIVFILYSLGRSIFDTLWSFAVIGPVAIFTGSRALREVRARRLN